LAKIPQLHQARRSHLRLNNGELRLSASDLGSHLGCDRITALNILATSGTLVPPVFNDPALEALQQRGYEHEEEYLDHLETKGSSIVRLDPEDYSDQAITATLEAMNSGVDAIAQPTLKYDRWFGRADVLLKIDTPSSLGDWSYEVVDTKLSQNTRAATILQLCMYSEVVGELQGLVPENMHVVVPDTEFEPETYRVAEYVAYYRYVKKDLEVSIDQFQSTSRPTPYPEPVEQCNLCSWWPNCNDTWRADDHLTFVADLSKNQRVQLREWDVSTLEQLAELPVPLSKRPSRGTAESLVRSREQARVQHEARTTKTSVFEVLPLEPARGFATLPEPVTGDVFFDIEGDQFIGKTGREYLLGWTTIIDLGDLKYDSIWSYDDAQEKAAFEKFMDTVMERWSEHPGMHVYHFHHYEPTALKKLSGKYATRSEELNQLLRAGIFVDLHRVTRESIRAGIERYSIKDLEQFYGLEREADLRDANHDRHALERLMEIGFSPLPEDLQKTVEIYNKDDCDSTLYLRNWLEQLRSEQIAEGNTISRPFVKEGEPSEQVSARRQAMIDISDSLLKSVPIDEDQRSSADEARWILGNILEYNLREENAVWWEFFRLRDLVTEDLAEERAGIVGLQFVDRNENNRRLPTDSYSFPPQEVEIEVGGKLHSLTDQLDENGEPIVQNIGSVESVDMANRTVEIKRTGKTKDFHPSTAFFHKTVSALELENSLVRIGQYFADNGIEATDSYQVAHALLLRVPPVLNNNGIRQPDESSLEAAVRLVSADTEMVLPIQGPPGSGKTYTGAQMICQLISDGKKVGITAVSHRVIKNLLSAVNDAAKNLGMQISIGHRGSVTSGTNLVEIKSPKAAHEKLLNGDLQVVGGTAWLWAREEMMDSVDVLFVDEAAQMSLANVLAASPAGKSMVLLGDPQQLSQPQQGTHPVGTSGSALEHLLNGAKTIAKTDGLFLEETWRLSPAVCEFTSELFYENRLKSRNGLANQRLEGITRFTGSGLWFAPVEHTGNVNYSIEEAEKVVEIYEELTGGDAGWRDQSGKVSTINSQDILIIAPYNAHVNRIAELLPSARVGTVDSFQGQEAAVVIYTLGTSSPEDAPRGMEFLYSLNRLNVATSRARCASIMVANPRIFEPECRTPNQVRLANAFCRYREMAQVVEGPPPNTKSVRATDHRGAPVELIVEEPHKNNPEEDGYWISEDGMLAEVHFNWDYDPDHNDWIREARKSPEQDTPDQD
jgi:predicted RecB family nuclease